MTNWTKNSWRNKPIIQVPTYEDQELLKSIEKELSSYPPLVFAGEVNNLKQQLAKASKAEAFIVQGGDCAETFDDFSGDTVKNNFKLMLQMSSVIMYGSSLPVVKIARMAGQFAKPRSSDTETIDGVEYPSYRGDIINSIEVDHAKRKPDPSRMLRAYNQSASTLNLVRAFSQGGYADLRFVKRWIQNFIKDTPEGNKFEEVADRIIDAVSFMEACGLTSDNIPSIKETDIFTSHEALLLWYEEALTREDSLSKMPYSTSGHMLWIGERTRQVDHAHIEFMRGIQNPIGVKVGPTATYDDLISICDIVNPNNEEGKLTFIVRMGGDVIADKLPGIISSIKGEGRNITWISDPMHGNTIKSTSGYKTRPLDSIWKEVEAFFDIHYSEGTVPAGVHLEMTGQDVTECIGGMQNITDETLKRCYQTYCDPRLNAKQSIELSFMIAEKLKKNKK